MQTMIFDANVSKRSYDNNGYLHIALTPISKAMVCPYLGKELDNHQRLGLEPTRIYYGLRDPQELKKATETFNNLPLLSNHHTINAKEIPKEYIIGSIGSEARFDGKYLTNSMCIYDSDAIKAVENGEAQEVSSSYAFTPDFTEGTFTDEDGNEIHYDFIMRNIRGNHIALVPEGRAGHDVKVADAQIENENSGKSIHSVDSANNILQGENKMDDKEKKPIKQEANDATPDVISEICEMLNGKVDEELLQAISGKLQEFVNGGEKTDEPIQNEDKIVEPQDNPEPVKDAEENPQPEPKKEETDDPMSNPDYARGFEAGMAKAKQAVDDATPVIAQDAIDEIKKQVMGEFKALSQAANKVKPLVGVIKDPTSFANDSAIYKFVLEKKGVKVDEYDQTAYKGMVDMLLATQTKTQVVAKDSNIKIENGLSEKVNKAVERLKKISC